MSGGSLGYVHQSVMAGDVTQFCRGSTGIFHLLEEARQKLLAREAVSHEPPDYAPSTLLPTPETLAAVERKKVAIEAALLACDLATKAVQAVGAGFLDTLDRYGSCDDGADRVILACLGPEVL